MGTLPNCHLIIYHFDMLHKGGSNAGQYFWKHLQIDFHIPLWTFEVWAHLQKKIYFGRGWHMSVLPAHPQSMLGHSIDFQGEWLQCFRENMWSKSYTSHYFANQMKKGDYFIHCSQVVIISVCFHRFNLVHNSPNMVHITQPKFCCFTMFSIPDFSFEIFKLFEDSFLVLIIRSSAKMCSEGHLIVLNISFVDCTWQCVLYAQ